MVVPKESIPAGKSNLSRFSAGHRSIRLQRLQGRPRADLTRNKNYWQKGLPYIDELVIKPVVDDQVRFLSLRSRDLDMIERTPYAFVKKVVTGEMPGIQIAEAKYGGVFAAWFSM